MGAGTRDFMESRFGLDFAEVRIHTDSHAEHTAQELGALAYTVGPDIFFAAGQYRPESHEGRRLLAHELTHVAQQGGGAGISDKSEISSPEDESEREADLVADEVVAGEEVIPSSASTVALQRKCAACDDEEKLKPKLSSLMLRRKGGARKSPQSRQLSLPESRTLGRQLGEQAAVVLLSNYSHPALQFARSVARGLPAGEAVSRELPVGGGPIATSGTEGERALFTTGGYSMCNLGGAAPIIVNNNNECTRPCTQWHEMLHISDWGACCERARAAYQAHGANQAAVMTQWNTFLTTNEAWFECRAYGRSVRCADAMSAILLCWAPAWLVRTILVGGGALAGGTIGSSVAGAVGAGTGAAGGLVGGPAAPVTVPAGAAAGFITGEVLGMLTGAGIGALLGAAAESLREACCVQVRSYRAHVEGKRVANCGAAGGAPVCTF